MAEESPTGEPKIYLPNSEMPSGKSTSRAFYEAFQNPDLHMGHYRTAHSAVVARAKSELASILEGRENLHPTVYKPNIYPWEDFDLANRYPFDLGFSEDNRERAKAIGIHYRDRVVDVYPRKIIERSLPDQELDPDQFWTVDLKPLTPNVEFLNHDRALFSDSYAFETLILMDLIGEGKLPLDILQEAISAVDLSSQQYRDLLDKLQQVLKDGGRGVWGGGWRKVFLFTTGNKATPGQVLKAAKYYREHMNQLKTGVMSFPGHTDKDYSYLKTYEVGGPEDFATSTGAIKVRFQVDVEKLLESRSLFADPEAILVTEEYGKTFIVPEGIPLNAIHSWHFWADYDGKEPPISTERK